MKNYEAICPYCGQVSMIMAESQMEANERVMRDCDCEGSMQDERAENLLTTLNEIIGEGAPNRNFEPVAKEVFDLVMKIGVTVIDEKISACSIKVDDTSINISRGAKAISVNRQRTVKARGDF